jgi:hypothetical protein
VLAVANELGRVGRIAAARTAESTDDPLVVAAVEVHVLARERRAPTVGAAVAVGLESPYPPAQQYPFELLDIGDGGRHESEFAAVPVLPSQAARERSTLV